MGRTRVKKSVHFPKEKAGVLLRLRRLLASLRQRISAPRPQRPEMLSASRGLGSCWRRREKQGRLEAARHPSIPGAWCVSPQTLADLMDRSTTEQSKLHLLDCRYPYEFQAGHIRGAINVHSPRVLSSFVERLDSPMADPGDPSIVVYCDFSHKRAPKIARALLMYYYKIGNHIEFGWKRPNVYILSGGYVNFCFGEETRTFCEPASYVPCRLAPIDTDLSFLRQQWGSDQLHCPLIEHIDNSIRFRRQRAQEKLEEEREKRAQEKLEEEREKRREMEESRKALESVLKTLATDTLSSRWGQMTESMDTEEAMRASGMRGM